MPTCVKCNLCGADSTKLLFIEKGWQIVQCRRCGLVYANPRPSSNELIKFYQEGEYSQVGPNYLAKRESKLCRARRELRKIGRYKKGGKLLDIGCGARFFLKEAQKRGWKVSGVDLSREMIEYAREEFDLNLFAESLSQAHFPSEYFDVITMYDLLEHLEDPLGILKETKKILKPDGLLLIVTPDFTQRAIARHIPPPDFRPPPEHLYYFTNQSLQKMLNKAGLEYFRQTSRINFKLIIKIFVKKKKRLEKVLIIGASCLGDMLLLTPAIRAIRKKYPQANFSILLGPRAREAVENNSWFSEVIIWDKKTSLSQKLNLIKSLRKRHFNLVVDFRNTLLPFFIRGEKNLTFFWKELFSGKNKVHEAERRLRMLPSSFPMPENKSPFFPVSKENRLSLQKILNENGIKSDEEELHPHLSPPPLRGRNEKGGRTKLIILNPGANWPAKRWKKGGFARVGDELVKKYKAKIIIVGGEKERGLAEKVKNLMREEAINLAGKTTLGELAALLEKSSLFITNDTGPMHLASAVKCPVVAIYGPGNWLRYGPWENQYRIVHSNLSCSPCNVIRCKRNFLCRELIKPADVLQAAESLLK